MDGETETRDFRRLKSPTLAWALFPSPLVGHWPIHLSAPTSAKSRISQNLLMISYLAWPRASFYSLFSSLLSTLPSPLLPLLQPVLSFLSLVLGMERWVLHILGKHLVLLSYAQLHLIFPLTDFFLIDIILLCSPG